jgi:hypothetical protein
MRRHTDGNSGTSRISYPGKPELAREVAGYRRARQPALARPAAQQRPAIGEPEGIGSAIGHRPACRYRLDLHPYE